MGLDPMRRAVATLMPGREVALLPLEMPPRIALDALTPNCTAAAQQDKPLSIAETTHRRRSGCDRARQPPSPGKRMNPINVDLGIPTESIIRKML
jgi:hypothetical protein